MRISLKWLENYVALRDSPEDLARLLTMTGFEVEEIERLGDKYKGFLVGHVVELSKHPRADRLTVCKVDTGREVLQIVCGAPNVAPGQKVAVGIVGAEVPRDQHDPQAKPLKLSQIKIRGMDSFGMICSPYELDLGEDKDGILVLDSNAKTGLPFGDYLGLDDTVFDVGFTPNRPDAMSHIGIAREIAAVTGQRLRIPSIKIKQSRRKTEDFASVKILDSVNCPRYTARVLMDLTVRESPEWMQRLLNSAGVRPVNNVVDITNYVLLETGHPLHAFDYDKLAGHAIIVKRAQNGQSFVTLDHKERKLRDEVLMICDAEGAVAVGGVMGGMNTEISESTVNVLLESAYFNPVNIRRTSKYLGLQTDASQHFERGADPEITEWAANRASSLMQELCGAEVLRGVIDVYPRTISPRSIHLRLHKVNEILGTSLDAASAKRLLAKLDLRISNTEGKKKLVDNVIVTVPTFRPDLVREIDLIEEIARMHGYDNIGINTRTSLEYSVDAPRQDINDELKEWFAGRGFREIVTNSMQDSSMARLASENIVEVANPISKDMACMRTSLVTSLLNVIRYNIHHNSKNLRLFELGKVYFRKQPAARPSSLDDYEEEERLILAISGSSYPKSWDFPEHFADIFDVKGELQTLFEKSALDNYQFIPYSTTKALTQNGLSIEINGEMAGECGSVRRDILKFFDIEQGIYVAELKIGSLEQGKTHARTYRQLSKYPSVARDIAVVVDEFLQVEELAQGIRSAAGSLLKAIELFDIYRGDQIGSGKKSCAFSLEYRSDEHTLTQEEVDGAMRGVVDYVTSKFNATLRM